MSKSTCTPASVLLTVFPTPTVKLAGVVGPSCVPLIVINSPGEIAPNAPLALLEIVDGCGTGTPVTVTVTGTVIAGRPLGVMVIVPLNVPGAVKLVVVTDTVNANGDPVAPVDPLVGVTPSQLPVLAALTETLATPPVLVTFNVCAGGAALPI